MGPETKEPTSLMAAKEAARDKKTIPVILIPLLVLTVTALTGGGPASAAPGQFNVSGTVGIPSGEPGNATIRIISDITGSVQGPQSGPSFSFPTGTENDAFTLNATDTSAKTELELTLEGQSKNGSVYLERSRTNPLNTPLKAVERVAFLNASVTGINHSGGKVELHYDESELGNSEETALEVHAFRNGSWQRLSTTNSPVGNYVQVDYVEADAYALVGNYHRPFDGGLPAEWSVVSGDWRVNSSTGRLIQDNHGTGTIVATNATENVSDYALSFKVEKSGGDDQFISALARSNRNASEAVEVRYHYGEDRVSIARIHNGKRKVLEETETGSVTLNALQTYRVKVELQGKIVTAKLDGEEVAETWSPRTRTGFNHSGIRANDFVPGGVDDENLFDDFTAEGLAPREFDVKGGVEDSDGEPLNASIEVRDKNGKREFNGTGAFDLPEKAQRGWSLHANASGEKGVEATFELDDATGNTSITLDSFASNPEDRSPPAINPANYAEVSTDNLSYHNVTVRVHYDPSKLGNHTPESSLKLWHYKNGDWRAVDTRVNTGENWVEGTVASLSNFSVAGSYSDSFDDNSMSSDWTEINGNWSETNQRLEKDIDGTGLILNDQADGGFLNYSVTVDTQMNGPDQDWTSVLLRSDGSGDNAIETRLDFTNDQIEVGYISGGTRTVVNNNSLSLASDTYYTVNTTVKENNVTVYVDGIKRVEASSPNFDKTGGFVGLRGYDAAENPRGPSGGPGAAPNGINYFDNFYVERLAKNTSGSGGAAPVDLNGTVEDEDGNLLGVNVSLINASGSVVNSSIGSFNFTGEDGWDLDFNATANMSTEARFSLSGNSTNVTVVFQNLSSNPVSPPPPGNVPVAPSKGGKFVNVSSTNLSYYDVRIRVYYEGTTVDGSEGDLNLRQYHGGSWGTVSTTVNTTENYVEGTVSSLSTFAVTSTNISANTGTPAPYKVRVVTNRYAILDDPNSGNPSGSFDSVPNTWGSDYWNGEETTVRPYALVMDQYGEPLVNQSVTFRFKNWAGTTMLQTSNQTDDAGIVNASYDLNGDNDWGFWSVEATAGNLTDSTRFIYNYWGCGNCHGDYGPDTNLNNYPAYARSPYVRGAQHAGNGLEGAHMQGGFPRLICGGQTMRTTVDNGQCNLCHQGYGGNDPSGPTDPGNAPTGGQTTWGAMRGDVLCQNCHTPNDSFTWLSNGGADGNGLPRMPSCFNGDCHNLQNRQVNPWRTTTVSQNRTQFSRIWTSGGTQSTGQPLKAHSVYEDGGDVPCVMCHGPMHNVTTPLRDADTGTTGLGNDVTEDEQCYQCHVKEKHPEFADTLTNAQGEQACTDCHTQNIHNVSGSWRYFDSSAPAQYDSDRNVLFKDDPAWGFWQRWEIAYNSTYPASDPGREVAISGNEDCASCHVGPNQKRGAHRIDLNFVAPNSAEYSDFGWNGTGLDCLGCHDSNLDTAGPGSGQEIHSAHPASYNGSRTECGTCHAGESRRDGGVGEVPQSATTAGTYTVTVFGVNRTYDASQTQTCQQCHGDWHRNPTFNTSKYPTLSQGLNETLQASASTNVTEAGYVGPSTPMNHNVSPGVKGYTDCTQAPCHRKTAHEAMNPATKGDRFPGFSPGATPGCDECHSLNRGEDHMGKLTGLYTGSNSSLDVRSACDTCHFEARKDEGYISDIYVPFPN